MEETILNALERTEKPKIVRAAGFIPGVIYGDGVAQASSVKFEAMALNKILTKHGSNAKVWVKYGSNKRFGFIKDIQRNPIEGKVIHIDVQLVSEDQEVRMQLPITFNGRAELEHKSLFLQVNKSDIEVLGKASLIPDGVVFDVSEKQLGDTVTIDDFNLDKQIKANDREDEIYAVVIAQKQQIEEEPAEEKIAE
ncbi:MAG: 50S ribosomal protein L25 [Desulfitobacteriaceae bacterium]|nr:50S ribosomal protein L25 [Desulfitobacteriaceae bacterium]